MSKYGNDATACGDANTTSDGIFNRFGTFDGDTDYLDAGNDESLRINGDLTISLWVNVTDISNSP